MADWISAAANLYNVGAQKQANAQNLAFAREQFAYQQQLNDIAMQREDTAVQRRVADLEAAGFNKRLAMDQSAGSQSLSAGNYNANQQAAMLDPASMVAGVTGSINSVNQIRMTEASLKATEIQNMLQLANVGKALKETDLLDIQSREVLSRIFTDSFERTLMQKDIDLKTVEKAIADLNKDITEATRDWIKNNNGQPIEIQTMPMGLSGNLSAGNALFSASGGFNLSGGSMYFNNGIATVQTALDKLYTALGDSPVGTAIKDVVQSLVEFFTGFGKKEAEGGE